MLEDASSSDSEQSEVSDFNLHDEAHAGKKRHKSGKVTSRGQLGKEMGSLNEEKVAESHSSFAKGARKKRSSKQNNKDMAKV